MNLIQRIDALLPQTQCGKCGHNGCKPYAEGIAKGEAINKCPPGGDETIAGLARLMNLPVIALDEGRGSAPAQVAFIREAECIGCTKCIQACPVDAIVGAAKLMHTVIVDECTGCDLCIAPCPVDCIDLHPLPLTSILPIIGGLATTQAQRIAREHKRANARARFEARNARLQREETQRQTERQARQRLASSTLAQPANLSQTGHHQDRGQSAAGADNELKQARINVAMSRAQLHKSLKAFRLPPVAEQAARLLVLQRELDAAERHLAALAGREITAPTAPTPAVDKAAINRARIQLAVRRAALKKAQSSKASAQQIATLAAEITQAEHELRAVEALANVIPSN